MLEKVQRIYIIVLLITNICNKVVVRLKNFINLIKVYVLGLVLLLLLFLLLGKKLILIIINNQSNNQIKTNP
jgi:hypothetical protein